MKLVKFSANDVHGYLPINIDFHEDITFLIGLNGAGKTSALRIITALLTPNLEELVSIDFSTAILEIHDLEGPVLIKAERSSSGMDVSVISDSGPLPVLNISAAEMQFLLDSKFSDENSPIREKIQSNPVFSRLSRLPTPIYLGIDRRAAWSSNSVEDAYKNLRVYITKTGRIEKASKAATNVGGVAEVSILLEKKFQEIRTEQLKLDEELRNKLFKRAFEYKPSNFLQGQLKGPSRQDVAKYKEHLANIERASAMLRLPMPELTESLTAFFDSMNRVVRAMEKNVYATKQKKTNTGPKKNRWEEPENKVPNPDPDYINWIINGPQADRVIESLELLDAYVKDRDKLNAPIARFIGLINGFLAQTNKQATVNDAGQLKIQHVRLTEQKELGALASGERQLLVMLAHLSLNPDLNGSGVFMVDEPELSLHIAWQEKFVDSIMMANPSVQFVLATHSPAIVLDRQEKCIDSMVG